MGVVLAMSDAGRVDAAWLEYQALAQQLVGDTSLLADRDYNERMARAHERWRRLFLAQERAG